MSEINPDDPRGGPRHVESTVVGDEHDTSPPPPPPPPPPLAPAVEPEQIVLEDLTAATEPPSEPALQQLPDTQEFDGQLVGADELKAAKYFSIAFMVVIIPLSLIILGMVTLAFVRSLDLFK